MKEILQKLTSHLTLEREEARSILKKIAGGEYNNSQVSSFLTVYMMRMITVHELAGFRDALLDLCLAVDLSEFNTIDLCGTGGDGKNTFNISTLSSFVVAGAGGKVAKHGNYGVSSSCGSSNVLEYLGYKFTSNRDILRNQLDKANICFLHAPLFHPAMKTVAPIRRELSVKTFFNMLGPMVNPSFPKNQMIGVWNLETARLYNYIYQQTDKNFTILYSLDGYDEISLTSEFKLISNREEELLSPEKIGFPLLLPENLNGGDSVEESVKIFLNIMEGKGTPAQNAVVIANSGIALTKFHQDKSLPDCFQIAEESLMSGSALNRLKKLLEL
ncbi:MAG: anthranilate phosphoribosyltransferase [Bacteroidetes bacterium GWE2_41_25]|nr:MAG: anthranilate phosphoribosyltransferase [Bacteroidetes bacterium GWA2_40_15]OFY09607.1 MAG: anthranilate phosphoribosyltransferase [Bacteroidetes bacterium GWE2_41_25]HAM09667.1 anthranilate phosphoribosyltransferase [Bacteroidales bacterium]HBQ81963.1 anthranilate phosphoribosyltransferase [Bacteroidales bacterium]HCU20082.1 anthranilate phosphoribosyltransferase [Bacteroidales bacterium]